MSLPTESAAPLHIELELDSDARLVLTDRDGCRFVGVEPVRSFPITDPDHWISLCLPDGREIISIADPSQLRPEQRALLERELARREFVPVIHQIKEISSQTDPSIWTVETDRGQTQFELRSDDDLRKLGPDSFLLVDKAGIRYLIPDRATLDHHSRKLLATVT
jgi:hypothetical protein